HPGPPGAVRRRPGDPVADLCAPLPRRPARHHPLHPAARRRPRADARGPVPGRAHRARLRLGSGARVMTARRIAGAALAAALALAPLGVGAAVAAPSSSPTPTPTTGTTAPDPSGSAGAQDCPHREVPAPPVDSSEVPAPGSTTPSPLPVPDTPIGGERLGGCGDVLPAGAAPPPEGLGTDAWVLADLDSGQVLAARDPHGRHRPASTIKVLLALVVLDRLDLDTVVTATEADAYAEGSS